MQLDELTNSLRQSLSFLDRSLSHSESTLYTLLKIPQHHQIPEWSWMVCENFDEIQRLKDKIKLTKEQIKCQNQQKRECEKYRQRLKENNEKYTEYKLKEHEHYISKKKRGVVKLVEDMNSREHRLTKRRWKNNSKSYRDKAKIFSKVLTPPSSPEIHDINAPSIQRHLAMKQHHKRKSAKKRAACYRENQTLTIKLTFQKRLVKKYRKRLYRNNQKQRTDDDDMKENKFDSRSFRLYKTIVKNIRQWYNRNTSTKMRRNIANVIVGKRIRRQYGLGIYTRRVLGISQRYLYSKRNKATRAIPNKLKMKVKVQEFIERDDNSRITTDKQATLTRGKVKMQKRLLNNDMKTLHRKYKSEGNKISYSLFCKLKPFWVVKPSEKDRNTCLCKIHENLQFKTTACYREDMVKTKEINTLIDDIVCSQKSKECMYRQCDHCKEKEMKCENADGKQVTWKIWKNQRIEKGGDDMKKVINKVVKENVQGTREALANDLNKELTRACRHIFNIKHQYKTLKYLQNEMTHTDIMMHIDFSENYNTKYSSEIQSVHFGASKQQISLHTGVAYFRGQKMSFCTISDCIKHGPAAIWAHLHPVITYLKDITSINAIHFISDGPTTQYRNKLNFYLWSKKVFEYGCKFSTWNFLEAAHGKGAADGVGAAIKRAADNQFNVNGNDITNGKDMMAVLQNCTSVKLFYIDESSIRKIEEELPTIKPLAETMKIHQLFTEKPGEVSHRPLSCFCRLPDTCSCFQPTRVQLEQVCRVPSTNLQDDFQSVVEEVSTAVDATIDFVSDDDKLPRVPEIDENLIGQYCVIRYDGLPYPGLIMDVDSDTEDIEVRAMCRIGVNRFFWPLVEDRLWYTKDNLVTLCKEPEYVTKRHQKLEEQLWEKICAEMKLDELRKK